MTTQAATRAETVAYARSFRGVSENPPYSNRVRFAEWYGANGQPWCAMYVSYVLWHVGNALPITTPKGFAYCPEGVNWAQRTGRWLGAGSNEFQPGDLIFYSFGGRRADHVGIVTAPRWGDGRVPTIEGNTSGQSNRDGGSVQERLRASGILGFARLDFAPLDAPRTYERLTRLLQPGVAGDDVKAWKQYMIVLGIAPEFALQNAEQLRTFGAETSANAAVRFKVLWNAIYNQRPGYPQYLGADPSVGEKTWQALIFCLEAQRARR